MVIFARSCSKDHIVSCAVSMTTCMSAQSFSQWKCAQASGSEPEPVCAAGLGTGPDGM